MTHSAAVARRLVRLGALVGVVALAACDVSRPATLRFDAERARWKVDRLERRLNAAGTDSSTISRRLQREHAEIARRFGPERTLGAEVRLDDDSRVRYHIAGSSALYAADIAARDSVDCTVYALLAERYAFDPEVALQARVQEGLNQERLRQPSAALTAYERALESPSPAAARPDEPVPAHEQLRADLEVHAALLAREFLPASEASLRVSRCVERLQRLSATWTGHSGDLALQRRLGEALAIAGRGDEAIALLQELLSAAKTGEMRAEIALVLGEVEEETRQRPDEAEGWYRRSAEEGVGRAIGNDARLHLGHLLIERGRPREAADVYSAALASGASTTASHRAEALYGESRCMDELSRPVDALIATDRGAAEEGPFALASAARRARYSRELGAPNARDEAAAFVERASRWAGHREGMPSLGDISRSALRRREEEAWEDVLDELRTIVTMRAGTAIADSARGAAQLLSPKAPGGP